MIGRIRMLGNEVNEEYPKLVVPIRVHPTLSVWIVKLTDGKEHTVAWGNLRQWLKKYAR